MTGRRPTSTSTRYLSESTFAGRTEAARLARLNVNDMRQSGSGHIVLVFCASVSDQTEELEEAVD